MSTFIVLMIVIGVVMISEDWSSAYRESNNDTDERLERLEKKVAAIALKLQKEEGDV